jgi:hypothetical protein
LNGPDDAIFDVEQKWLIDTVKPRHGRPRNAKEQEQGDAAYDPWKKMR